MARLDALAAFTEVPGQLTRRYLTPGPRRRHGPGAGLDGAGRHAGAHRRRSATSSAATRASRPARPPSCSARTSTPWSMPATMTATSACWPPSRRWRTGGRGERLAHAIEVVAFGEEEGVRFPTHLLTSSALVGTLEPAAARSPATATASACARRWPPPAATPRPTAAARASKDEIAAYLELHIEQGPVLDDKGHAARRPSRPSTAPFA